MNQVMLTAGGGLAADGKAVDSKALSCLGHQLLLAPECTLRSYFRMLERYACYAELGDFFQILQGEFARCPSEGCLWPDFSTLEFAKVVEMIGYPGQPRMEVYNVFQGVVNDAGVEIRQLPLKVLLDMPLRLGRLKHVVFGDRVDTFTFETVYTLFEFIDGIAWELSFHGAPPECQIRS